MSEIEIQEFSFRPARSWLLRLRQPCSGPGSPLAPSPYFTVLRLNLLRGRFV
jgi:hypothetical protein